jgi:hypothetical protein
VLTVDITPELPAYATGVYSVEYPDILAISESFFPLVNRYALEKPITNAIHGCQGTCIATVHAPALAVDHCVSEVRPINFAVPLLEDIATLLAASQEYPQDHIIFGADFRTIIGDVELLEFNTTIVQHPENNGCTTTINTTSCYLVSATGEYDVTITDHVVSLTKPSTSPKIVSTANNTRIDNSTIEQFDLLLTNGTFMATTLSGIAFVARSQFNIKQGLAKPEDSDDERIPALFTQPPDWFVLQHTVGWGQGSSCVVSGAIAKPT